MASVPRTISRRRLIDGLHSERRNQPESENRRTSVEVSSRPRCRAATPVASPPPFPFRRDGPALAAEADVLIHECQYDRSEYPAHVGWGQSTVEHAIGLARLAGVRRLVAFHHDPEHDDDAIDRITADAIERLAPSFPVTPGEEGMEIDVG